MLAHLWACWVDGWNALLLLMNDDKCGQAAQWSVTAVSTLPTKYVMSECVQRGGRGAFLLSDHIDYICNNNIEYSLWHHIRFSLSSGGHFGQCRVTDWTAPSPLAHASLRTHIMLQTVCDTCTPNTYTQIWPQRLRDVDRASPAAQAQRIQHSSAGYSGIGVYLSRTHLRSSAVINCVCMSVPCWCAQFRCGCITAWRSVRIVHGCVESVDKFRMLLSSWVG